MAMDTPDLTKQLLALADCLSELGLSELTIRKEDGERVRIVVGDEFTQLRQDYKKRVIAQLSSQSDCCEVRAREIASKADIPCR